MNEDNALQSIDICYTVQMIYPVYTGINVRENKLLWQCIPEVRLKSSEY